MKIIKTYVLSEKTLEKDIDKFIRELKRGVYQWDYKSGMQGLKIIKAYFRMIQDEFDKQNYEISRICYKKILFILMQREYDYLNYEDIMSKFNSEKTVCNYFRCLIKLCSIEELYKEYLEYLEVLEDYSFESADRIIIKEMPKKDFQTFLEMVRRGAENLKGKDYEKHGLIYFLLEVAKFNEDRKGYDQLCDRYEQIIGDMREEFDEKG